MNETHTHAKPGFTDGSSEDGASLSELGERVRDLAYEKLADELLTDFTTGAIAFSLLVPGGAAFAGPVYAATKDDERASMLAEIKAEGRFDHIPDLLDRYEVRGLVGPDADNLLRASSSLSPRDSIEGPGLATRHAKLVKDVNSWTGEAGTSFAENVVTPLADVPSNQMQVALELLYGLEAHRQIVEGACAHVRELAKATLTTLETYPGANQDAVTPFIDLGLIILSLWAGKKVPTTPKEGLDLALSAYSTGQAAGGKVEELAATVDGESVYEIIEALESGISALNSSIDDEERKLTEALQDSYDEVYAFSDNPTTRNHIIANQPKNIVNPANAGDLEADDLV